MLEHILEVGEEGKWALFKELPSIPFPDKAGTLAGPAQ